MRKNQVLIIDHDLQTCKDIRGLRPMPILILSTSSALSNKLETFKTGADDYLTKPFETEECLARVYALCAVSMS